MYYKIFLITFYLIIIILESFNSKSTTIYHKKQSIDHPSKDIYANISCEECLKKNIFFPEYQNKYSRINELNDTQKNYQKIKMKYMVMITFFIVIQIHCLTTIILSISLLKKILLYMKRLPHQLKI